MCDLDAERAGTLAGERPVYTDWRELIERESPRRRVRSHAAADPPRDRRRGARPRRPPLPREADRPRARGCPRDRRRRGALARGLRGRLPVPRRSTCSATLRDALAGQQIGLVIGDRHRADPERGRGFSTARRAAATCSSARATSIDLERAVAGEVVAVQAAAVARRAGAERRRRSRRHRGRRGTRPALRRRRRRLGPDRVDARRACRPLLARRARQRLLAAPRARSRRSRSAAARRGADVDVPMRGHPMDRTLERFLEAAAAGARESRSSARRRTPRGRSRSSLACEAGARRRRHRRGRALGRRAVSASAPSTSAACCARPRCSRPARRARRASSTPAAFKRIEDAAVREVVALQEAGGHSSSSPTASCGASPSRAS